MAEPTDFEQLMLELINRARADPESEAARYGIDLNTGLPSGTLSNDPKQPLAMSPLLIDAARAHSTWMLDNDVFSHAGANGSSAQDRMTAAGYQFVLPWSWGENISWDGTPSPLPADLEPFVLRQHEALFLSEGHRTNILDESFREAGIGQRTGVFSSGGIDYNASMITQNFAVSGSETFLVGVVYEDLDGDAFYSPGEGLDNVTVSVGGQTTETWSSGGYQLPINAGTYTVTFSGGGLASSVSRSVTLAGENEKLDLVVGAASPAGDTIGLFEPTTSKFFLNEENTGGNADITLSFGPDDAGWFPLSGDWDAQGSATIGLYDAATGRFYLSYTNTSGTADAAFRFGPAGEDWTPIAGDWNGNGEDTVALYNGSTSTFYLRNVNEAGSADTKFNYGPAGAGWIPIAGDWDGNGEDSLGLYSPDTGTFYLTNSHTGGRADTTVRFGPIDADWLPLSGDWDGDGDDSIGLYDPSAGRYYLRNENLGGNADLSFRFGPIDPDLRPITGDWSQPDPSLGPSLTTDASSHSEGVAALHQSPEDDLAATVDLGYLGVVGVEPGEVY